MTAGNGSDKGKEFYAGNIACKNIQFLEGVCKSEEIPIRYGVKMKFSDGCDSFEFRPVFCEDKKQAEALLKAVYKAKARTLYPMAFRAERISSSFSHLLGDPIYHKPIRVWWGH
ncbi:hypothetical protein [Microbulbifer sp. JMSA003]|uniref:hypothetical protein n=1 Tax=Microbulbifer sp. JMSA003 TaxID=3243369 RepID=UPI0040395E7E